MSSEELAIRERYKRRRTTCMELRYSPFNQAHLFIMGEVERTLLLMLEKYGLTNLKSKKILDVGCGRGQWLRKFIFYGAEPENLYGIELLEEYAEECKRLCPQGIHVYTRNADWLDFPDGYFDMVTQFVMFTSILDNTVKLKIAKEMLRVTSPRGTILWYDFRYDNPRNKDVKGVDKKEIEQLFTGCDLEFRKVVLAPPIVRLVAPVSMLFCHFLNIFPILKTHYLVIIKKKV